jgi:hypothetical protein
MRQPEHDEDGGQARSDPADRNLSAVHDIGTGAKPRSATLPSWPLAPPQAPRSQGLRTVRLQVSTAEVGDREGGRA